MPCTDPTPRRWRQASPLPLLAVALALAGCAQPTPSPAPASAPRPTAPAPAAAAPAPAPGRAALGPAPAARSKDELRLTIARRLVAAHPDGSYTGTVPEILLAIPVLEIELNRDGSVRNIKVLREPTQARDTTRLAIDAVRRAAPYGDVSRLPRPWTVVETFLFNDERKFKPRTLDD